MRLMKRKTSRGASLVNPVMPGVGRRYEARRGRRVSAEDFRRSSKRMLIRAEEVVSFHDSAVIKSPVRSGRANQDGVVGKINAQRSFPRIHELAFLVQLGFAADDDDNILGIASRQGFGHVRIAAARVAPDLFLVLLETY